MRVQKNEIFFGLGLTRAGETIPDVEKCSILADVYGITVDSLIKKHELDDKTPIPPAPTGKYIFGAVTVSERGQIVIPKQAREVFNIKCGERLIVLGDNMQGIALVKESVFTERMNLAMESALKESTDDLVK